MLSTLIHKVFGKLFAVIRTFAFFRLGRTATFAEMQILLKFFACLFICPFIHGVLLLLITYIV